MATFPVEAAMGHPDGCVGPKSTIVGMPREAASLVVPVSTPIKRPHDCKSITNLSSFNNSMVLLQTDDYPGRCTT